MTESTDQPCIHTLTAMAIGPKEPSVPGNGLKSELTEINHDQVDSPHDCVEVAWRTVFQRATLQAGYQSSGSDEAAQGLAPRDSSTGQFGALPGTDGLRVPVVDHRRV